MDSANISNCLWESVTFHTENNSYLRELNITTIEKNTCYYLHIGCSFNLCAQIAR